MDSAEDNISQCSDESLVLVRINIPDLGVQKCMQFHREELVWDVKQQVLAALPKEMKESFNYGLYCPPSNGKAGKFLDEERPLLDYPFPGPVGYLELKYKRRVYKLTNVDEKQIKQLHTKANLRRMLDHVAGGQAEKIGKLCAKGLDPNFHCHDTGETPLSLAATQKKCNRVILALANGGALLDFRTRDGTTALHRAVEKNNLEGIKTLLDLGASPNYKDNKGLTALYSCVLNNADAHICELLLHDHAAIGAADLQGWQEVHQACRNGLVQHLEHLLFYGADMNARNASGNTPLHVCAVNEQESCARVLLFRGADKDALNFANQTPYQVAVIAGNLALAEVINNHLPEDVVPFREPPKYNPRRRASVAAALNRTHSDPRLEIALLGGGVGGGGVKPPSPSPSNRSLPPFSSASSLSETSTGSSSTTGTATTSQPSGTSHDEDSEDTASVSVITEKSVTSESSSALMMCGGGGGGVTCAAGGYDNYPERPAPLEGPLAPGLMCVCLENYSADIQGHLQLSQGDIIEVTGSADFGLLEGILRHQQGLFPASCVQEVRLRHPEARFAARRVEGRRETSIKQRQQQQQQQQLNSSAAVIESKGLRIGDPRTVVLHKGKKGFGFVLRGAKATSPLMELMPSDNCPALQYLDDVDKGGIADLAGLKKGDFLLTINGEDVSQASHEHVVNLIRKSGELVSMAVVTVQRVVATGAFAGAVAAAVADRPQSVSGRQCATLPRKLMRGKAAPAPPRRDPRTTLSVGRARARSMVAGLAEIEALDRTLMEYDSEGRSTKSSSIESLPNKQQLHSSDCLPHKTAAAPSLLRSHPAAAKRMTAAELQEIFLHQRELRNNLSKNNAHVLRSPKVYGSVAAMKRSRAVRPSSRPEEAALLSNGGGATIHKVFHSTPDLNDAEEEEETGVEAARRVGAKEAARRSHSQEDMAVIQLNGRNIQMTWCRIEEGGGDHKRQPTGGHPGGSEDKGPWQSIEEIYNRIPLDCGAEDPSRRTLVEVGGGANHPPPPTHPPPPPPVGQVVRVDVSRSRGSEYAKVSNAAAAALSDSVGQPNIMSSFRPGDSAKLYASPQEIGIVGYHARPRGTGVALQQQQQHQHQHQQATHKPVTCASIRSRSLPPNVPPPPKTSSPSSSASSETETSSDSAGYTCSTFKKSYGQQQQQQRQAGDAVSTDSGNSSERASQASGGGGFAPTTAASANNPYAQPVSVVPHFQQQPAIRYPQTVQMPMEPYIPEPDYDVSDEETTATPPRDLESSSPPEPPQHPPPPPPPTAQHRASQTPALASFHSPGLPKEWVPDGSKTSVAAAATLQGTTERKKLPPTPPSKRRDKPGANAVLLVNGGGQKTVAKQTIVGELVQRTAAVPKTCSPAGSPATSSRESVPPATKEKPKQQPMVAVAPPGESQKLTRSSTAEAPKELPAAVTIAGKPLPPVVATKTSKTAIAAAVGPTASTPTGQLAPTEITDFKQIIARKAAERQRRASYTATDPGAASPAGESPKVEFADVTPHTPSESAKEVIAMSQAPPVRNSPPPPPPPTEVAASQSKEIAVATSHASEDDIAINVKETISAFEKAFEKKSEAVKSTSPSVVRSAPKKPPEEPPTRKVLKGSHSQIFEARAAEASAGKGGNAMKPSRSCPHDLAPQEDSGATQRSAARGDTATTANCNEAAKKDGEDSDDSDDMNDGALNLKAKISETETVLREELEMSIASRRILTRNVVSLAKFPPPIETGETDAESDITEPTSPSNGYGDADAAGRTAANSFDSSLNGSAPSSPDGIVAAPPPPPPTLSQPQQASRHEDSVSAAHQEAGVKDVRMMSGAKKMCSEAATATAAAAEEEKIQRSMNLIKIHASSLQEVNTLAGLMVPPPPGFDERNAAEDLSMIAPPPEFSDDIHVPIKAALESRGTGTVTAAATRSPLSDMDLEEAEVAAKSAAAALAAAAGGLHLSCPSFIERNASKILGSMPGMPPGPGSGSMLGPGFATMPSPGYGSMPGPGSGSTMYGPIPGPVSGSGSMLQKTQQHYHPPTTMKSARQMVRPSSTSAAPTANSAATAKVRLLPPGHNYAGSGGSGSGAACNGVMSPDVAHCYADQGQAKMMKAAQAGTAQGVLPAQVHKEFRAKSMSQWTTRDVSDWLESLFLPEYKARFEAAGVDGRRLSYLDTNLLSELGVKRVGHRMNMERSLRRHSMMKQ